MWTKHGEQNAARLWMGERTPVGRTSEQAAQEYAARFAGRLIADSGLVSPFGRTRNQPTLAVDRRAAAFEMRRIHDLLTHGYDGKRVVLLRVVAPSSAGRTPDLVMKLENGEMHRVEVRAFTSAPKGHSRPHRALSEATVRREQPVTAAQLARAIRRKAQTMPGAPSQLDAPLDGVPEGGDLTITSGHRRLSQRDAEIAINRLAPGLGRHIHTITLLFPDAGGKRLKRVYACTSVGFVLREFEVHGSQQ